MIKAWLQDGTVAKSTEVFEREHILALEIVDDIAHVDVYGDIVHLNILGNVVHLNILGASVSQLRINGKLYRKETKND